MHIDLQGRVALVTGAGRGIGKVIATTLAQEGCKVVALDVDSDPVEALASNLQAAGHAALAVQCDVTNSESVQAAVDGTVRAFGGLDILVNNAGVFKPAQIQAQTEDDWDLTFDVNVKGVFLLCRFAIPVLKLSRYGRILNAASFAAIVPSIGSASYAASKAAVVSFTRVLAGELGPYSITANSFAPGMIPTEINDFATSSLERQTMLLDTLSLRKWGKAREVAELVCFLASDHAAYITGALIDVSGGKLATQIPRVAYDAAAAAGLYEFGPIPAVIE